MHIVPPDPRLSGRWVRTLLTTTAGHRDDSTEVVWLQAGDRYVDLRGPATAVNAGFAGRLVADGADAHWLRTIDLLPPTGTPDQGSLDVDGDEMVETGTDGSYVEHWRRSSRRTDPIAAFSLRHGDFHAVLVRIGVHVGWAHASTETEVSMGRVTPQGIVIDRSNRPGRRGLQVSWEGARLVVDGRAWSVIDLQADPHDLIDVDPMTLGPGVSAPLT